MTSFTVRISDDLKRDIEALKVEVSEVIRSAPENELRDSRGRRRQRQLGG